MQSLFIWLNTNERQLACHMLLSCHFLFYFEMLPSCVVCCLSFPPLVWFPLLFPCCPHQFSLHTVLCIFFSSLSLLPVCLPAHRPSVFLVFFPFISPHLCCSTSLHLHLIPSSDSCVFSCSLHQFVRLKCLLVNVPGFLFLVFSQSCTVFFSAGLCLVCVFGILLV